MKELFKAKVISQEKFSISLDLTDSNSYIDFGPPDTSQYLEGVNPIWIPMVGTINPYWQNIVDGFYFGNLPLEKNRYTTK